MKKKYILSTLSLLAMLLTACGAGESSISSTIEQSSPEPESSEVTPSSEEQVSSETPVSSVAPSSVKSSTSSAPKSSSQKAQEMKLSNKDISIEFSKTGARINSLKFGSTQIADRGFVAGRVANRIANASFILDGKTYNLNKNNGNHTLHGGNNGFGDINWTLGEITDNSISFSLISEDGNNGFPGKMTVGVKYTLSEDNKIDIEYTASSDKKTVINLTNHLYMNLNGLGTKLDNHQLMIDADKYTEVDSGLIPTGNFPDVANTKYDYRTLKAFANDGTIDHNYVLNGTGYRKVAEMLSTTTNIKLDLYTDQPGLQLYNAKGGGWGNQGDTICLESQHFPDAIHHEGEPGWDSIILEAGQDFYSKTTYQFTKIS